jgi:hypothetical protein
LTRPHSRRMLLYSTVPTVFSRHRMRASRSSPLAPHWPGLIQEHLLDQVLPTAKKDLRRHPAGSKCRLKVLDFCREGGYAPLTFVVSLLLTDRY